MKVEEDEYVIRLTFKRSYSDDMDVIYSHPHPLGVSKEQIKESLLHQFKNEIYEIQGECRLPGEFEVTGISLFDEIRKD